MKKSIRNSEIKKSQNKNSSDLYSLKKLYSVKKTEIYQKLEDFQRIWLKGSDEDIFEELAFCILTPQSKAKVCWKVIERLRLKNLLHSGSSEKIRREIRDVRFKNKKAAYLIESRSLFSRNGRLCIKSVIGGFKDIRKCREWLVKNIKGIGYKEASHFLRNIGFGDNIAILDRHILKNLKELNIISYIPKSLSKSQYLKIEKQMKECVRAELGDKKLFLIS
ncbi:MAG: N-glycosylase/DNA lyase, partial [Thermodesulfovibrionales bacterium]